MAKKFLTLLFVGIVSTGLFLPAPATFAQSDSTQPSNSASQENETENEDDGGNCEAHGGDFGWFMCPAMTAIDASVRWLDGQIANLLEVDNDFAEEDRLADAASNIRSIAFSILVPIMLVMVISTALGFDFISAYTVKKALPRLVIAVIFIAVSYPLLTFFIDVVEAAGRGVGGLITSPFGGFEALSFRNVFSIGIPGLDWVLLGLGGIIVIAFFGTTLLTVAAIAFLILIIRQLFIVMLLLIAPLAILAWIFPGNDKLWNNWWSLFSKLLFMYPLIMGLIAMGRVFAYLFVGSEVTDQAAIADYIFGFIAYLIPYAFIPFTFKVAGGMFATVTGALNEKSRGIFDHQRKKRAEKRERWSSSRAINPNRFAKGSRGRWAVDKLNSGASAIMDPKSAAKIYSGSRGGKALLNELAQSKWEDTQKLGESISKVGMNDRALKALSTGVFDDDGNELIRGWNGSASDMDRVVRDMKAYRKPDGSVDDNMALGAKQLEENGAYLTTVSRNDEYGRASVTGAAGLALASQGFADNEDVAKVGNLLDQEGLSGVGSMYKTQAELAGARAGALTKPGYSVGVDEDGNFRAGTATQELKRIQGMSVQDIGGAKEPMLKKYHKTFTKALSGGDIDGKPVNADAVKDIESTLQQAYHAYTNPAIKAEIRSILTDSERVKLQQENGLLPGAEPADENAVRDAVERKLSRGGVTQAEREEMLRSEEEPPENPFGTG
ncbi:MAG: hypothetical protein U5L95_01970 [Candidatus Saccharibacteria bacterium]|nr:hypothetical protein [Candidatus Saccharibacteria bacterium]